MIVKDWMTPDPQTVSPDVPVTEAARLLREGGFRQLPVVVRGMLIGIVTDRDLKEAAPSAATTLSVFESNYLLDKLTVREVMTRPVHTVTPGQNIETAALLLEQHKISGLPVVDDGVDDGADGGVVVGIITISDILRAVVEMLGLRQPDARPGGVPG